MRPILIIQGAQYGSEAKGAIAAELCIRRKVDYAVRTGTINAGHTVFFNGSSFKMQTIPTGWVNPNTRLIIGAGAFIHPDILWREIRMIQNAIPGNLMNRLIVDYRAGLHLDGHTELAAKANRHHSMGATGKGCSEAIMSKIRLRGSGGMLFKDYVEKTGDSRFDDIQFEDTVAMLHAAYDTRGLILLEGTQGSLLDLHLSDYPYTTHKQTQAAQWVTECGLAPGMHYETILVARTFPIRVAGNSGRMPGEIGWQDLARDINVKLRAMGKAPRVNDDALAAFEAACQQAHAEMMPPSTVGSFPSWRLETWTQEERERYPKVASELHRRAFELIPPMQMVELSKLFEFTTVTRKLRRISTFDADAVRWACMVNRPHSIALTFANYLRPELWDLEEGQHMDGSFKEQIVWEIADDFSAQIGVPVEYMSFGAEGKHIIDITE